MPKTIVVIPTYNERGNLNNIVDEIMVMPVENLEVLVVDDNSPDGTGQIAEHLKTVYPGKIHVMHRMQKSGLGAAYRAGFQEALDLGADYIVQMDADFSHDPAYLPEMVDMLERHDLVLGSRWVRGGTLGSNWSFSRWLLSWFANRVYIPTILNVPIADATGGFRAWRRATLQGIGLDRIRSNGYIFQTEMCYVTHRLGFRIAEIPIHFPDRENGASKMSTQIKVEAALRAIQLRFLYQHLTPENAIPAGVNLVPESN